MESARPSLPRSPSATLPGVRVVTVVDEPIALLDARAGAVLAVIIDAGVAPESTPGRVRRCAAIEWTSSGALYSHGWGIPWSWPVMPIRDGG